MRSKTDFPKLKGRAILAPMSGFSDIAYRALCKRYDCALTYTEFVSANAIMQGNKRTFDLLRLDESEVPRATQLFGSDPRIVGEAVSVVSDNFDIIDLNCGCPAPKVVKNGAGSALLKSPSLISSILNKMISNTNKCVTAKIRLGVDDKHLNGVEVARLIEDAGCGAVAVHGRHTAQGYSGVADWNAIKEIKEAVDIPVIGNGDIVSAETFVEKVNYSGVDYGMIGRGALGKPFLFAEIEAALKGEAIGEFDRLSVFREFLELAGKYKLGFEEIKHHAMFFTKGVVGGSKMRTSLARCKTLDELRGIVFGSD